MRSVPLIRRVSLRCGVVVLAALSIAGCDPAPPDEGLVPSPTVSSPSTSPPGPVAAHELGAALVARYTFDDGLTDGYTGDGSGKSHHLRVLGTAGGEVTQIPHGSGLAVRFPPPCAPGNTRQCPRAILEAADTPALNPGVKRLRYGAVVRVAPAETSKGSNVVQKGFSTTGSQWKLQIDGTEGRPSCVVVGPAQAIHVVIAEASIADGSWHAIDCDRDGTSLTIRVDGVERGRVSVPADLTMTNDSPLRIGGKNANQGNDQFFGALDDVYVAVG